MNSFGGMLNTGILATLLFAFWEKVKQAVWYFLSFFICRAEFMGALQKYGSVYCWDKLKHKKSLSPIYVYGIYGSTEHQKVFIREMGFNNLRFFLIGKVPVACVVYSGYVVIYGIKPFINQEKIMVDAFNYYNKKYSNEHGIKNNKFCTTFKRGSLNKIPKPAMGGGEYMQGGPRDSVEQSQKYDLASFEECETLGIGCRINYTESEYHSIITFSKNKMIENLYLTDQMKELKKKLERWYENKDWFLQRDIQWKRGVLLHGEPGTGKTSFIVSLAEYFGIPCFIFDLSTITNDDLEYMWENLKTHTPCFAVFEDFDSIFNKRENIYLKNGTVNGIKPVSFDCILNTLDGAKKYDGIVTFITTNDIDKIDFALGGGNSPRPGRIDYVYEMNGIGEHGKYFIAKKIFNKMQNEDSLINSALNEAKEGCTPAQFKELCISMALNEFR